MSSTLRGYDRHKSDYYRTPLEAITKFLNAFEPQLENVKDILDPCAGGDEVNVMAYPHVLEQFGFKTVTTMDIREDSRADIKLDFLDTDTNHRFDMVISNPPFKDSLEFIQKGLEVTKHGGIVVFLLRLNFFGTKARNEWLRNNMPTYCYVHGKRMSFTEDGKKDSIEYAHFVWIKGHNPNFTELHLLEY